MTLGQRCRLPNTSTPIDRHATAAILALLLHTIGQEAARGTRLALAVRELGVLTAERGENPTPMAFSHLQPGFFLSLFAKRFPRPRLSKRNA